MSDHQYIQKLVQAHIEQGSYGVKLGENSPQFLPKGGPLLFTCPVCRTMYETSAEAEKCRDKPYDLVGWEVGDMVIIPGNRLYRAPGMEWVAFTQVANPDSKSHFDHHDTYHPWWVITHIGPNDRNPHRVVVTVCSLAEETLRYGWNPANGIDHHAMYRAGVPQEEQRAVGGSTWWQSVGNLILKAVPPEIVVQQAKELAAIGISTRTLL